MALMSIPHTTLTSERRGKETAWLVEWLHPGGAGYIRGTCPFGENARAAALKKAGHFEVPDFVIQDLENVPSPSRPLSLLPAPVLSLFPMRKKYHKRLKK